MFFTLAMRIMDICGPQTVRPGVKREKIKALADEVDELEREFSTQNTELGKALHEVERLKVCISEEQSALAFAQAEIVKATEKYEEAVIDRNETDEVLDKLRDILHRTAIALKGKEPPLTRHSFHDLPELAGLAKELAAQAMDTIREKEAYAVALRDAAINLLDGTSEVQGNGLRYVATDDLIRLRTAVHAEYEIGHPNFSAPVATTTPCNEQCEPNGCADCPLDPRPGPTYCDKCDGTGWTEGGEGNALGVKCRHCRGHGIAPYQGDVDFEKPAVRPNREFAVGQRKAFDQFLDWWAADGHYYDPDPEVSWHDKRRGLASYVWVAAQRLHSQGTIPDGEVATLRGGWTVPMRPMDMLLTIAERRVVPLGTVIYIFEAMRELAVSPQGKREPTT